MYNQVCTLNFELPYLTLSNFTNLKLHALVKCYCKRLEIKVLFSSFHNKNLMNVNDFVPKLLRSCVIYKYNCAGCNSIYVGETSQHMSTCVREHLYSDKSSHIFKHIKVLINAGSLAVVIVLQF